MTNEKEKSPQEKAQEQIANAKFDSVKEHELVHADAYATLAKMKSDAIKKGHFLELNEDNIKSYTQNVVDAAVKTYGFDGLKNDIKQRMSMELMYGLNQQNLGGAIAKNGFTGSAITTGLEQTEERQEGMAKTSGYHFDALLPDDMETRKQLVADAAKGLSLDKYFSTDRLGKNGFAPLAGLVGDVALSKRAQGDKFDLEGIVEGLKQQPKVAAYLNDKVYNTKKD